MSFKSGDNVIVRTYSAGVFAGELVSQNGKEVELKNARRLWFWNAASLSQLAMEGVKNPDQCKFPCPVSKVFLTEVIEILSLTEEAKASIDGVKIWEIQYGSGLGSGDGSGSGLVDGDG